MKKLFSSLFCGLSFCGLLFCPKASPAQSGYQGPWIYNGAGSYGLVGTAPVSFAELPQAWVDNTQCNPPGGNYDTVVILGTTLNIGPNDAGESIGSPYALTPAGLEDAMNNWRDNADGASQTQHFADKWWLIQIPAGTILTGTTYDTNQALISIPGKVNGSTEPTKCLVIDSTTPLVAYDVAGSVTSGTFSAGEPVRQSTTGALATLMNSSALGNFSDLELGPISGYPSQTNFYSWVGVSSGAVFAPTSTANPRMACGRGLPGFGGARNPGCSSPNDQASMWEVELPAPQALGHVGIYAGEDLSNPSFCPSQGCWVNHVVLRDLQVTLVPGAAQSANGVHAPILVKIAENPLGIIPCDGCQAVDHVGLERYYIHGNDPGDAGQPSGACSSWTNEGYVTVAPDPGNAGTSIVTWNSKYSSSINTYFGMTFTPGSTINIGGTNYTIANTSYTQGVLNGVQNTQISIDGSVTLSSATQYIQSNPPAQYANGCGDDVEQGVQFNCDNCWRESGYIEKIHWWGNECVSSLQGFDNGPQKEVNNWEEAASTAWFSGGGPVDQNGGPGSDNEIRRNYSGRDLNYRQLSATAGNSPTPPFGCGSVDSDASQNTCPFSWAVKNSFELKLGHRVLIDGNIIENSWPDGQQGFCMLINARTCSGGSACGIFNPVTELPNNYIDNIRFSNNWVRNCAKPIGNSNRSGSPTNGGGVSLPVQDEDFVNNLMTNIADNNQFGNPGNEWQITTGQDNYNCAMSYTGASTPYSVTANCAPYQADATAKATKITSVGNAVTIYDAQRWDPMLCVSPMTQAQCIAAGMTVNIVNHPGWNGTFAMTSTNGNWAADGTGGNNITYTDNINSPGTATLCDNSGSPTCTSLLNTNDVTWASLGYKMTDISVGDDVYASNVGQVGAITNIAGNGTTQTYTASMPANTLQVGLPISVTGLTNTAFNCSSCTVATVIGTNPQMGFTVSGSASLASTADSGTVSDISCVAEGFAVGANSATYAATGTVTTGLTVIYPVSTQPGSGPANCDIDNGAGFPKYTSVQNNTFMAANVFSIFSADLFWQPISNYFINNVFADNDSSHSSDVFCSQSTPEGTNSFNCWDLNTFEFYSNVMTGRSSSNWSVVNCPAGANCVNSFPTTVNCANSTPDPTCVGLTGFMGANPTITYPLGSCSYDGSNPMDCPLMTAPWSNNFNLNDMSYVGSSSYANQGVNIDQLNNAMTRTQYVCPAGSSCGPTGPFPD